MRKSWTGLFRRLAAGCIIGGSSAWYSAMCYAQIVASDVATDPVYADGWQAGDNGGTGFSPWNFETDTFVDMPGTQAIDDGLKSGGGNPNSSAYNDLGQAWRLALPDQGALPRAGRGFAPLQVGQTLRVITDNPTDEKFFKGYFIRLNSTSFGGDGKGANGNICYGSAACHAGSGAVGKTTLEMFEYFTYGNWSVADGTSPKGGAPTTLFDFSKINPATGNPVIGTSHGMQTDFTLTGTDTYTVTMTPLDNPGAAFTRSTTLANPGAPVDWIEFTMFNTPTSTAKATDFYVRSLQILTPTPPGVPGDYNGNGVVDASDYVVWRDHLGTSFQLSNEVSGTTPGSVTQEDYAAWRALFGNTSGAGSGIGAGSVPEPGMLGLFFAAAISMCASGWRRIWQWRS
jgi:hypothetical protein